MSPLHISHQFQDRVQIHGSTLGPVVHMEQGHTHLFGVLQATQYIVIQPCGDIVNVIAFTTVTIISLNTGESVFIVLK